MLDERYEAVFKNYEIEVRGMSRTRGAFLLDTNKGIKLVKEYTGSQKRLEQEDRITRYLWEAGYKNVDRLLHNNEDMLITSDGQGKNYIIKDWFKGEECTVKEEDSVMGAAGNLGRLHAYLRETGIYAEISPIEDENLKTTYEKHNRELKRVKSYLRAKKQKNPFEVKLLNYFDNYYEKALEAVRLLEQSSYDDMLRQSCEMGSFVHGSYTYHNVIFTKKGPAVVNFDKAYEGIQIFDLYYFLRKVMEKTNWNETMGLRILEEYQEKNEYGSKEQELLYILLFYPEKYWKIANFYYNSRKNRMAYKSMEKLEAVWGQEEKKERFLTCLRK